MVWVNKNKTKPTIPAPKINNILDRVRARRFPRHWSRKLSMLFISATGITRLSFDLHVIFHLHIAYWSIPPYPFVLALANASGRHYHMGFFIPRDLHGWRIRVHTRQVGVVSRTKTPGRLWPCRGCFLLEERPRLWDLGG